jgi:hypothetical protein
LVDVQSAQVDARRNIMDNVYTCSCGNQTWTILENQVQCAACQTTYECLHTSVKEFNHMVVEEIEELEEAAP